MRSLGLIGLGLALAGCQQIFGLDTPVAASDGSASACTPRDVATGNSHTCAVDAQGGVWCWGGNWDKQVGPQANEFVYTPTQVVLPSPALQVGAGRNHSCALLEDHSVWCWGANDFQELGPGTTDTSSGPVLIPGVTAATLSVGGRTTCITNDSDGAIACWGRNNFSQGAFMGDMSATPTPISGTAGTRSVATGHTHSCAIDGGGRVQCWGRNDQTQAGFVSNGANVTSPMPVSTLGPAVSIAASSRESCAVLDDGRVVCWGTNYDANLGMSTYASIDGPVITPVTNAAEVAITIQGACARRTDGTVACWGASPAAGTWDTPGVRETSLTGVRKLAAGFAHTCALVDGGVACWGKNIDGELGRGTDDLALTPLPVAGVTGSIVAVGDRHACAASGGAAGATLSCWGYNERGQLGIGTTNGAAAPVSVTTGLSTITGVSARDRSTCAWNSTAIKCWGDNRFGMLGTGSSSNPFESSPVSVAVPGGLTSVDGLAVGNGFTCAILSGTVNCWGKGSWGALGNGGTASSVSPVASLQNATRIAASDHVCAVNSSNTLYCWGRNGDGQLGDNSTIQRNSPTQVATGVSSVVVGRYHTCALSTMGAVTCWGYNGDGQLGIGSRTDKRVPTAVSLPGKALALGAGEYTTCAKLETGDVYCWGDGWLGEVGTGNRDDVLSPTKIPFLGGAGAAAVSGFGGCLADSSGQISCWGVPQLQGQGSYAGATPMLVELPGCQP